MAICLLPQVKSERIQTSAPLRAFMAWTRTALFYTGISISISAESALRVVINMTKIWFNKRAISRIKILKHPSIGVTYYAIRRTCNGFHYAPVDFAILDHEITLLKNLHR